MRNPAFACLFVPAALCAAPAPASACSVLVAGEAALEPSLAEKRREARRTIERATAVIDGEVVRPMADGQPALVRAARVLKGPVQDYYKVVDRVGCDRRLDKAGERLRLILVGGPELYSMPQYRSYPRFEDRVLRSDRRRVWPYRAGKASPE